MQKREISDDVAGHSKQLYSLEQESFYSLSFLSWINPFKETPRWELRSANRGFFTVASFLFLFGQMITLFDLAYEEDLASYHCKGDAARFSVVICGTLSLVIVALKMLKEERRCFAERLSLIRLGTEFTYFNCFYKLLFEDHKIRTLKVLCYSIFHSFRVFGVTTFVYVATMEQIMLYKTSIDYIINSVVVLVIAEIDELAFWCLKKTVLSNHDPSHTHGKIDAEVTVYDPLSTSDVENTSLPPVSASLSSLSSHLIDNGEDVNQGIHLSEATELTLSEVEKDAFLIYDYWILRLNCLSMIIPLTRGKLTGHNCSESSVIRVSEIGMIALLSTRMLLNVFLDLYISRRKFSLASIRHGLWSLLEHGIPCLLYVFLMYAVFVEAFKPPTD